MITTARPAGPRPPAPYGPAPESMYDLMREDLPLLNIGLDEWTGRMMRWHFADDTGSPFWLRQRPRLGFDPLRDIGSFADLRRFGTFDPDRLRRAPVRDLLPRGFAGRPFRVFETGGATGAPGRIVNVTRLGNDVLMFSAMLRARGLAGLDIVAMTPSGPHAYGHFVESLADSWAGAVCAIDFDPRWVKHELRSGRACESYLVHLLTQTMNLLERREAGLLFTTTRLLLALAAELDDPLAAFGIRAVCTGGTSVSAEEERFLRAEFLGDVQWIDTYGNTLVGHALPTEPLAEGDGRTNHGRTDHGRSYHLAPPFGEIRVAEPADWTRTVGYGQRGRVVTTTLLEDLFIPNLIERDSAVRARPHPWFGWDGVAQVGPAESTSQLAVTEGVY
jgi:hypothetical protein